MPTNDFCTLFGVYFIHLHLFENGADLISIVWVHISNLLPKSEIKTSISACFFSTFVGPGHLLQKVRHHHLLRLSCNAVPSEAPPGTWMCLVRCALWILDISVLQLYLDMFPPVIKDCLPYLIGLTSHERFKQRVHRLNAYLSPKSCSYVLVNVGTLEIISQPVAGMKSK